MNLQFKKSRRFCRGVFLIYISFGLLLFVYQRDFMYFPSINVAHQYQTKQLINEQETIDVIVLNSGHENAIIYFGGNGEAVVNNALSFIKIFPFHTVYLVNYRGYGGSTGTPTEQALYSDAQLVFDNLVNEHIHISVIGRSLGTGVATYLATTRAINKMVLITPYDSIQNIAQDQYPVYPMWLLLKDKYLSSDRIKDINSETLIILAEMDVVIPEQFSRQLIDMFPPSQVTVKTIAGAGHNNLTGGEKYNLILQEFLQDK